MVLISVKEFEKAYIQAVQQGTAAVFAGAGLGRPSGYVDWKDLLRNIASAISLDVAQESDLIEVAQYYKNETGTRAGINTQILNAFLQGVKENQAASLLASMPIDVYWTTNYDHLLEDALRKAGKRVQCTIDPSSLAVLMHDKDVTVYKMHGDYQDPAHCVLTKDDYETYNQTRQPFTTMLQGHLITKTFLFIGFSFDDPNLRYILSRIRILLGENVNTHYCFFEKEHRTKKQPYKEFHYRDNKQQLQIHDLQRYGIQAVLLDSYSEIPQILERIKLQAKTKDVFISGSAHTYGEQWTETGIPFISKLTHALYAKDCRIVTGHGRGVGSYVISAILEEVQSNAKLLESHLLMRAFPYEARNDPDYEKKKKEYRDSIAQVAGISIFIFGNKIDDSSGDVILAEGVWCEFEAAKNAKNYIIPVGVTGYMAQRIYQEVAAHREEYPYLSKMDMDVLGSCLDPDILVEYIVSIVCRIRQG